MTPELLPAIDTPPRNGKWVDSHDVLEDATEEDYAEGNALGEAIDIDDDTDNGLNRLGR